MRREVEVRFSPQAKLIIEYTKLNPEEIVDWFCKDGIVIGGGNIVDFMKYKKDKG